MNLETAKESIIKLRNFFRCLIRRVKKSLYFIYDFLCIPFRFLNGKPIRESANLLDYKYTRWCIAFYLALVGDYLFIKADSLHYDHMTPIFQQLLDHKTLTSITVTFAAAMGLIALIHRSIVSDYQIKIQYESSTISNYLTISDKIKNVASDISNSGLIKSNSIYIRENSLEYPHKIFNNLFPQARLGIYDVNSELTQALERITINIDYFLSTFIPHPDEVKLIYLAPKYNPMKQPTQWMNLLYPEYIDTFLITQSVPDLTYHNVSNHYKDTDSILKRISHSLCLTSTLDIEYGNSFSAIKNDDLNVLLNEIKTTTTILLKIISAFPIENRSITNTEILIENLSRQIDTCLRSSSIIKGNIHSNENILIYTRALKEKDINFNLTKSGVDDLKSILENQQETTSKDVIQYCKNEIEIRNKNASTNNL
ncbi:MAG: hypothetical protein LRY66_05875 [Saccharospirillaceae bacterium]|nr:hypothetical protein [Saccharospirillaceae bacterium]MCD8530883.1 hypothetical protein [Saccharospirillaceae bacterium]